MEQKAIHTWREAGYLMDDPVRKGERGSSKLLFVGGLAVVIGMTWAFLSQNQEQTQRIWDWLGNLLEMAEELTQPDLDVAIAPVDRGRGAIAK